MKEKNTLCRILLIILFSFTFAKTNANIVGVSSNGPFVFIFNENTWAEVSSVQATLTGHHLISVPGITYNPANLKYYAIVELENPIFNVNHLVTINIVTGECTDIGEIGAKKTSLAFSSIAYDHSQNVLYAMCGLQGLPGFSGNLFTLNMNTAEPTLVAGPYAGSTDGQNIAYNYDDNNIYLWAGAGASAVMLRISTIDFIPVQIPFNGYSNSAVQSAVYKGLNLFSATGFINNDHNVSFNINSSGVTDTVTTFNYVITGLAYSDPTLPVELSSFNSLVNLNSVTLKWSTTSELNNFGFELERKSTDNEWFNVAFINGNGNSNVLRDYFYIDKGLSAGKFNYRLKQIDFNGSYEYHELNNDVVIETPSGFELMQNFPNPFNPTTSINYNLPFDSKVTIVLMDISGREILTLLDNENIVAGYNSFSFNGSDLSSGIYFYKITAVANSQTFQSVKKMALVK